VEHRKPVKETRLDLFNPNDGYWESLGRRDHNKDLGLLALWRFIYRHGVHERTLAELRSGLAYDQHRGLDRLG
jgi:hypothetical protein